MNRFGQINKNEQAASRYTETNRHIQTERYIQDRKKKVRDRYIQQR